MATGLLLALLAAAPVKLAAPGLQTVGIDSKLGDVYLQRIVTLAKQPELLVVTNTDIQQVLGLERQKELLGCESNNCMSELAGAMGADALLYGSLSRMGGSITLNLRVVRAADGVEVVSASVTGQSEAELQDWIELNARGFGEKIIAKVRGDAEPETYPGWIRWAVGAVGVGLAVGGGITLGLAHSTADQAAHPSSSETEQIPSIISRGRSYEQTSVILFVLGGVALATSVVLFLTHDSSPSIALIPLDHGVAFSFGGRFPW